MEVSVGSGWKAALHAALHNLAAFEGASDFTPVLWSAGRSTALAVVRAQEGSGLPGACVRPRLLAVAVNGLGRGPTRTGSGLGGKVDRTRP